MKNVQSNELSWKWQPTPVFLPGESHGRRSLVGYNGVAKSQTQLSDLTFTFKPRQCIKKQIHYFANKSLYSRSYGFSVVMYECESWTIKKAEHRRIDAFELWCQRRLLRIPWTARRSNQSILNQSCVFIGRTDAKAETPILWPPHAKSWLIGKDPDSGRDWGQEEKGTTEDEMPGWHHQLNGHEFG